MSKTSILRLIRHAVHLVATSARSNRLKRLPGTSSFSRTTPHPASILVFILCSYRRWSCCALRNLLYVFMDILHFQGDGMSAWQMWAHALQTKTDLKEYLTGQKVFQRSRLSSLGVLQGCTPDINVSSLEIILFGTASWYHHCAGLKTLHSQFPESSPLKRN